MQADETVIEMLASSEIQTLNERITDSVIDLVDYQKHDGGNGTRKTGKAILVNKVPNLTIIDVDINKNYDDELKETVRKSLLDKLSDDDVIVKTGSGGLHIYCNTECFPSTSNRMIKCYSCNDFDIDIMTSFDETKRSLIVMADSKVRDSNHKGGIKTYSFIKGSYESILKRSVNDILNDLDITIKLKQTPEIESIKDENISENENISDELAQALVDGIADFEVHNDGGYMPIDKEVTLFTLFQAINALPSRFINEAYDNVYQLCKLTDNAKDNFENAKARYQHLKTSPFVLCKIERLYQTEYYNEFVKPLLKHQVKKFEVDLKDSFCLTDVRAKAESYVYKNCEQVIEDLSKVIRFIDSGNKMYIQKDYDAHTKTWKISFVTDSDMRGSLKMIKLWKEERKTITAYDVLLTHLSQLTVKGVKFNSDDKDVFSTFMGYKYNVLDNVNYEMIEMFMNFVKEIICDSNEVVYKYVMGWIANMIQHPGKKNETALILKGLQGIGKNRFTDIISELLSGYSAKNVTEISELTGNFNSVVENKILIVLNELKNVGDDRLANFNALKSIITDDTIRINEKNQPRRTAENVANFIFCTNNPYPVKIEKGDRRYVVLQVNGKLKGQFDYFEQLMNSCTKEFYDNLLTYFIKYDLNGFNVRNIPMTEAKEDLIEASSSPLDIWINDHYDELIEGIQCSDALISKPSDMKDKTFQLQIKDKCNRKQRRVDGKREWFYVLKDECKGIYKQTVHVDDEAEDFV